MADIERHRSPDLCNLDGLLLLLAALEAEGRTVTVLNRSWFTKNRDAGRASDLDGVDYLVVEDETWQAWMRRNATPG